MTLKFDMSQAHDVPCNRCGWLDSHGSIEAEDDTRNRKVFCRQCVGYMMRVLMPNGQFGPHGMAAGPVPVAVEAMS